MVKTNTIEKNCDELFKRTPPFLKEYANYHYPLDRGYTNSFYRKLLEIERFLLFYHKMNFPKLDFLFLSYKEIEELPLDTIEKYFKFLKTKATNKKAILSILSSFWSYFTIYSFSLQKGRPIFYRHAFDEWKVGYKKSYKRIIKEKSNSENVLYNINQFKEFLDFYDNSFILYLDTLKKVVNFRIKKERDLAAIALLMGTGITVDDLSTLTIKNIDMRKKKISLFRDGNLVEIPIMRFSCPYIAPYVASRRQLFVDNGRIPELFLSKYKLPMGSTSFTNIISQLSKLSNKPLNSLIIRNSYHKNLKHENKQQ